LPMTANCSARLRCCVICRSWPEADGVGSFAPHEAGHHRVLFFLTWLSKVRSAHNALLRAGISEGRIANVRAVCRDLVADQFLQRHPENRCDQPADRANDVSGRNADLEIVEWAADLYRSGEAQGVSRFCLRVR